jgi:DNA-binding transcriptional MerR regulator
MNTQIQAMRKLGFTDEEIAEVIEADKKIDQGEKLFELTAEQEKASKQARQADRKPRAYDLDNTGGKRNKKADNDKSEIMLKLLDCFDEYEPQVINAEREFTFTYNERKFKITLSAPRT